MTKRALPRQVAASLRALSTEIDRLDQAARKAAMKEIRESEWFGLEAPTIKVSPHATQGKAL